MHFFPSATIARIDLSTRTDQFQRAHRQSFGLHIAPVFHLYHLHASRYFYRNHLSGRLLERSAVRNPKYQAIAVLLITGLRCGYSCVFSLKAFYPNMQSVASAGKKVCLSSFLPDLESENSSK